MPKIIHITDLHYGDPECERVWQGNTLPAIRDYIATNSGTYVIVVTGDLVDNGAKANWAKVQAEVLTPLRALVGDTQVLVAPGNHDYGHYHDGLNAWIDPTLVAPFKEHVYGNVNEQFPRRLPVADPASGNVLVLLGLDSNQNVYQQPGDGQPNGLWGLVGDAQMAALGAALTSPRTSNERYVVYLHHNPFGRFRDGLTDAGALGAICRDRVDCLLWGHTHDHYGPYDKWNIDHCYDGGTSTGQGLPQRSKIRCLDLFAGVNVEF